jgi:ParB family chromosome partitioning protein
MLAEITLDRIEIPDGRRAVDPDVVARLKNSIAVVGLQHPITVAKRDGGYRLLAGAHRLTAFRELGMERISANVVELDDVHAELVELDENLARNELSPAERSAAIARRKAIYERLASRDQARRCWERTQTTEGLRQGRPLLSRYRRSDGPLGKRHSVGRPPW